MKEIPTTFKSKKNKVYQIVFDCEEPLYLGTETNNATDLRENNGRTHYVSAGRGE